MNPIIETLNHWGANAVRFAWPMLWQSSALIVILFVADFALRRRVRAAVRYALWLVVMLKLLLPPSLALPTGVAWWLFPASTPAKPQTTRFVVSYGDVVAPSLPPQPIPAFTPTPQPRMSAAAWTILAWSAISAGLLVWLTARWRHIVCDLKRATPVPAWLGELFDETKHSAGLSRAVCLRVTTQAMSPAVCGLFRPIILLPQSLVEKLSPVQLRAVLLHELVHLRRGDVWTNCAQALVQIVYWWHPLLWFANARIRRVREEAVDDAVMLTLRDEAEVYAPTLLEVAKLAFHRPLASLGLVGILESRSALRQRIERLINFHAPRKAGLTFVSFIAICVFSAVALPMEKPIPSAINQPAPQAAAVEQTLTVKINLAVFTNNIKTHSATYLHEPTDHYGEILLDILRGEGVNCNPPHGLAFNTKTGEITTQNTPEALEIFRQVIEQLNQLNGPGVLPLISSAIRRKGVVIQGEYYMMQTADFDNLVKDLQLYNNSRDGLTWWSISPDQFTSFGERTKSLGLRPLLRPRVQTRHGIAAYLPYVTETNYIELSCLPFVAVDQTQRFVALTVQMNPKGWLPDTPAGGGPVRDSTNSNVATGEVAAEDNGGIVLRAKNPRGDNLVMILGVQITTNNPPPAQFKDRLTAIVTRANDHPATNFGKTETVPDTSSPNSPPSAFNGNISRQKNDPDTLVQNGKLFYEMGRLDEAERLLTSALAREPENQAAHYYMNLVQAAKTNQPTGMIRSPVGREKIVRKLNRIQFDRFGPYAGLPLSEIVRVLNRQTAEFDSDKTGIHFFMAGNSDGRQPTIDANTGLPSKNTDPTGADINSVVINIDLTNVRLTDVLDGILLSANKPIQYSILDNGIVFSSRRDPENPPLETRTFKVDPIVFVRSLETTTAGGAGPTNISQAAKQFFRTLGLNSDPPKSVFFNDRLGVLFIRATGQDLDTVEKAVQVLNYAPPSQIHIKARFIEVPEEILLGFGILSTITNRLNPAAWRSITPVESTRVLLQRLESTPGIKNLAEPEVTTLSGRQVQMRAITTKSITTQYLAGSDNSTVVPPYEKVESGPVLDVIPLVSSDGYTIDLRVIASVTEFLGYDKPTNSISAAPQSGTSVPTILPRFQVHKFEAHIKLWDGQTTILGAATSTIIEQHKELTIDPGSMSTDDAEAPGQTTRTVAKKQLLVLVTATLVDAAGNRIHSDNDMFIAPTGIPPQ
jgi:beta-lactamase regulating signal transducer with metallopeptidase domain